MKKIVVISLAFLTLVCFTGCSSANPNIDVSVSTAVNSSSVILSDEQIAENKAIEIFQTMINKLEKGELASGGKELEDLAKKYPDNETINTYYNFDGANTWLTYYERTSDEEGFQRFEELISLIDLGFDGVGADFIVKYIEDNLGLDRYNEISGKNSGLRANFNNLSDTEKIKIIQFMNAEECKYGDNYSDSDADKVWALTSQTFGISEGDIMSLFSDADLMKQAYTGITPENEITEYDAILDYEDGSSIIAISEDILNQYISALVEDNQETMTELKESFQVSSVPKGTKINIIEKKLSMANIHILDGLFAGEKAWVLIESVQEK